MATVGARLRDADLIIGVESVPRRQEPASTAQTRSCITRIRARAICRTWNMFSGPDKKVGDMVKILITFRGERHA